MKHDPIPLPTPMPLVDNFAAPEVFATGISGCGLVHGTVLLTLETVRCDHGRAEPVMERVVAGRIALTIPAAQALVIGLNDYLARNGIAPAQAVVGDATRQ